MDIPRHWRPRQQRYALIGEESLTAAQSYSNRLVAAMTGICQC
jgi:hypothetical protein